MMSAIGTRAAVFTIILGAAPAVGVTVTKAVLLPRTTAATVSLETGSTLIASRARPLLAARKVETAEKAATPRLTKKQVALFAVSYFAYVAIYFVRKPVSVVRSTLEAELGVSLSSLGVIDTAMLAAYAAGQFLTGTVVKLLGRDKALLTAFGLCGLFCSLFGYTTSVPTMAALWGLCGFFAASVNPLLVLFVADLFPASVRATAVGLWQTSQQLGGVASNGVASAVLLNSGWQAVFTTSGMVVAAFVPLLAIALPWAPAAAPAPPPAAASKRDDDKKSTSLAPPASPLSLPGVRSVAISYTLVKMARYCLMFWLPYFFTRRVGMGPAASALVSTIFDLAGVVGSVSAGFLVDAVCGGRMIGIVLPITLATAAAFAGWAALCFVEGGGSPLWGGALHIVAMALVGFLIATPDSVLGGAASRNLCDYAGASSNKALAASVSGLVNGCGSLGAIAQGLLTAQLVEVAGWEGLFVVLAAAMLATAALIITAVNIEHDALATSAP